MTYVFLLIQWLYWPPELVPAESPITYPTKYRNKPSMFCQLLQKIIIYHEIINPLKPQYAFFIISYVHGQSATTTTLHYTTLRYTNCTTLHYNYITLLYTNYTTLH
jgi:hypothetical protein